MKRKNRHGVETEISVLVWNPTVANLTLMALGSSAPEIMLAAIETMMNLGVCSHTAFTITSSFQIFSFFFYSMTFILHVCLTGQTPGELGPSTIVGMIQEVLV